MCFNDVGVSERPGLLHIHNINLVDLYDCPYIDLTTDAVSTLLPPNDDGRSVTPSFVNEKRKVSQSMTMPSRLSEPEIRSLGQQPSTASTAPFGPWVARALTPLRPKYVRGPPPQTSP